MTRAKCWKGLFWTLWEDVTCISSTTKRLGEILHPLPCGCYLRALLLWLGSLGANWILFATRLLFFIKTLVHHFSVYTFFTLSWRKEFWRRIHLPVLVSGSHLWLQRFTSVFPDCPSAQTQELLAQAVLLFFFRLLLGIIDVMIINHLFWLICVVLQWSHRMSCDIRRRSGTGTWSCCETILKHIILIRLFVVYVTFKTDFLKDFCCFWDKNVSAKGREWFCVGWSVPWHHRISVLCQDETSGGGFGHFLFSFLFSSFSWIPILYQYSHRCFSCQLSQTPFPT